MNGLDGTVKRLLVQQIDWRDPPHKMTYIAGLSSAATGNSLQKIRT